MQVKGGVELGAQDAGEPVGVEGSEQAVVEGAGGVDDGGEGVGGVERGEQVCEGVAVGGVAGGEGDGGPRGLEVGAAGHRHRGHRARGAR